MLPCPDRRQRAGWRFAVLAGPGQDAGVPLIAVNGIELYYESRGTRAALVARQMHALIPGSRLVMIDGGHLAPLLTRHEQLVSEVSAFLTAAH
jgi:hypothetical protein